MAPEKITARAARIWRLGPAEIARRIIRRIAARLDDGEPPLPIDSVDVADSAGLLSRMGALPRPVPADRLRVGWVCTPPALGSGGHTTLFRMVSALAESGVECTLFLYDRDGSDIERHGAILRHSWPDLRVRIADAREGIRDVDACVASSWEMAHVLASRIEVQVPLLYFIQDFEPYFYPRGSLYSLAEDTYRFGFTNIALGNMVANELSDRGIESVVAPFGCDTDVYRVTNSGQRPGVVFFARPGVDRRGYLLAKLALGRFHDQNPDVPIHVFGAPIKGWTVPVIHHGKLSPTELNALYNQCVAGIALSFTNISLVAEEMLAAGTIPVVNDSKLARADIDNPAIAWAPPTPGGIADALSSIVRAGLSGIQEATSSSEVRRSWGPTQAVVSRAILSAIDDADVQVPLTG